MLVELRIQFDRLELFLPIGLRRLERHIVGRVGGGLLVGHRVDGSLLLDGVGDGNVVGNFLAVVHGDRNTLRAVAENRCGLSFIPNANPENPNCERPLLERFARQPTRLIARVARRSLRMGRRQPEAASIAPLVWERYCWTTVSTY